MAPMKELQLSVIYDPEKEEKCVPDVDLVLVHGFGGDIIGTWTCKAGGCDVFWPLDLLLPKQPRTRILSFGYDAGETAAATIRDNARTMLAYLNCQRDSECKSRPIVFLGHCLGGLIIRQAMRFAEKENKYKSIASATKSIMFFGTPHGGGDKKGWLKLAKRYKGFGRKCKMIDVLGKNTDDLIEIDEDFCRLISKYTIVNFIETQPLRGTKKLIVDKTSATKVTGFEELSVTADHLTLCQFSHAEDSTFLEVCRVIRESIPKAKEQVVAPMKSTTAVVPPLLSSQWSQFQQLELLQRMLEQQQYMGTPIRSWDGLPQKGTSTVTFPRTQVSSIDIFARVGYSVQ